MEPPAAQQGLPMPSSENKAHRRDREPSTRTQTSTRKRSREAEAEQVTDLRLSQQPRKRTKDQKLYRATAGLSSAETPKKRQPQGNTRKRTREDNSDPTEQARKRHRTLFPDGETADPKVANDFALHNNSDITEWVERVAEEADTVQHQTLLDYEHLSSMHRLLAEKKNLQRKRSSSSVTSNSPSDQGYQDTRYATKLEANGSFMKEYRGDVSEDIKDFNNELCRRLLENEQPMPRDSLFSDEYFEATMETIQDRNEAMINETISSLMFPNVEVMAIRDAKFSPFVQSVDEGWSNCKKVTQTRPQPDSAVGFKVSAFSAEQLQKLQPFLGDLDDKSYFRATYYMLFPFMTREVKRGNIGLDIADRQNAHSHTVALRGLVALFRLFGREQELHGKILTYSIAHDHRTTRFYGHRATIQGQSILCWREEIDAFDFRTRKGKDRWKCRQFYLNALDEGLKLLEVIRTAIDDWIPDPALESLQRSDTSSTRPSGLLRQFDDQSLLDNQPEITGP
ncbi:hypothetical protein Vi05172_g11703 [Venturia inaequalis]|nr:hypothetical protein Vi05172_g11703 [Venturia inaequalis]